MDKLTKEQRRKNMQAVKSKASKIETTLAKMLFARGYRYRKNDKTVFGTPDLTFKKYKIAIFIDGEFWHGKDWEIRKNDHKTNKEFWHKKIERNIERDKEVITELEKQGWSVIRFWGKEIEKNLLHCVLKIEEIINAHTMYCNESISIEEVCGKQFKLKIVEPKSTGKTDFTHYLHNNKNDIANNNKKDASEYDHEHEEEVTLQVAEESLQYGHFDSFDIR